MYRQKDAGSPSAEAHLASPATTGGNRFLNWQTSVDGWCQHDGGTITSGPEQRMGFLDRFRKTRPATGTTQVLPRAAPTPSSAIETSPIRVPGQPRFAVIDVETSGLSVTQHRIVEIAVVTTDPWGRVLDEWVTRINPRGPVGATHIHGITAADVAHAPVFADVIAPLTERLAGAAIAAHHAAFDLAFVRAEYARAGWDMPDLPALCTLRASEFHLPTLERRRLADCCWAVGTPLVGAHSALGDARATASLLAAYMNPHIGYPPLPEHVDLPARGLAVRWPAGPSRAQSRTAVVPVSPRSRPDPSPRAEVHAPVRPALVTLVERFSLIDALDEGAPAGALAYLEKLAEVFEDGEVTVEEADDLEVVAQAENLGSSDVAAANQAFVLALAHAALADGKVTRSERAELQAVSDRLRVNSKVIPALLNHAEQARNHRLSAGLAALPADWAFGEPLRVGDKVVFTGCDEALRTRLEEKSENLGVRIVSSVSAKTAMIVSDGTMDGGKAAKARELGTRTEHPTRYAILLDHLQPTIARAAPPVAVPPAPAQPRGVIAQVQAKAATSAPAKLATLGASPAEIRAWARAVGYEVGTRGRLHQDILTAYSAAHSVQDDH